MAAQGDGGTPSRAHRNVAPSSDPNWNVTDAVVAWPSAGPARMAVSGGVRSKVTTSVEDARSSPGPSVATAV